MTADTPTAPERIWAWDDSGKIGRDKSWAACFAGDRSVEYVRADLCRAPVAQDAEPVADQIKVLIVAAKAAGLTDRVEGLRDALDVIQRHPAPQPSDEADNLRDEGVSICDGCGCTTTGAEFVARSLAEGRIITCCPERKMRQATRADWDTLRAQLAEAEKRAEQAERREQSLKSGIEVARKHLIERPAMIASLKDAGDIQRKAFARAEAAEAALKAAETNHDEGMREATRLAKLLWERHYKDAAPDWEVLDTVGGVVSQIDNMIAGIVSDCDKARAALAAAEDHADVLAAQLDYMGDGSWNEACDSALSAHTARRSK